MMRTHSLLTGSAVKLEVLGAANGAPPPIPPPANQNPHPTAIPTVRPFLSVSTPSWIVRTESNVLKEVMKKPDPPCVICEGSGRVDCHHCQGKGRINQSHLIMLPKGEWPKWCRTCGGSGLGYCTRCLGTGEYRYIMGFQFMKIDANDHYQCPKGPQVPQEEEPHSLTHESMDSGNEN